MKKKNINAQVMKLGGYSMITTAVVLAIVIILNLAVNLLPSRFTKYSTSSQGIYDISDSSRDILSKVKDDVTVYIVAESNYMDEIVEEYVARYTDLNSKVKYQTVDPAIKPTFVSQYTDEALSSQETSLIVVNNTNGRSRVVTNSEIYTVQYSEEEMMQYYYYGITPTGTTYFNIEQELTSAIDYVTAENLPVIYYTSGHGEITVDDTVSGLIDEENIDLVDLPLLTEGKVPEDATAVLINCATKDFTEEEVAALKDYTDRGGNIILLSYYNSNLEDRNLTNLYGFTASMGLEYSDVWVFEGSASNYYSYYGPSYFFPTLESSDFTASLASNTQVLMYYAHAITLSDSVSEDITLSELMSTTVKGYAKSEIDENTSHEKEEGDAEGSFCVGAMAEKTVDSGTGRLIWFASPAVIDGGTASYFSNLSYLMSVLTSVCEKEASVTIDAKALQVEALSVSQGSENIWGIILIGVIPVIILGFGFVIWNRRIKR